MKRVMFLALIFSIWVLGCNARNPVVLSGTTSPSTSIPLSPNQTSIDDNQPTTEPPGTIAGCPLFPQDNIWSAPIDTLPVDPNSEAYIQSIGADTGLHPDFGAKYEDQMIGIPITIVKGQKPSTQVSFEYADESDPGPYLIPDTAQIEGGPNAEGDRHVIVLDQDACKVYEIFKALPQSDGTWSAGSGAIFDLNSNALRPSGWTSADAAGLPIFAGLVRYDEVAAGAIHHALRFTVRNTQKAFIWPARHRASDKTDTDLPPMGQRFRLKASFDLSGFSPEVQVILKALKTYGMILADNGSNWYISGTPDERWDNDTLVGELKKVVGSDFEAVDEGSLMVDPDSGEVRQPAAEQPATVSAGESPGGGHIVFSTADGQIYRLAAQPGAQPEDLGARLDVLGKSGNDEWVNISPSGAWYLVQTERFDPTCVGWSCLVILPANISKAEVIKADGNKINTSFATISSSGDRVVFAKGDGPHQQDLWVTNRFGNSWSTPVLITADSPYAWNSQVAISADGNKVVFDCGDQPYGANGTAICEVGMNGSDFRVVLKPDQGPGSSAQNALHHPAYAPDGSIVMEADWYGEQIWRVSLSGRPTLINKEFTNDNSPCVLPDGRIASLWMNRPGGTNVHELKVMTPDGRNFYMALTGVDIADIGIGCGE